MTDNTTNNIQTRLDGLVLAHPDPDRDGPFAVSWFRSPHSKETWMLMGNPEHTIVRSTLTKEVDRIRNFLTLEKAAKQLTWMIRYDNKTIGATWLELDDTEYVKSPAFHIMIGDIEHRGRGFGKVITLEMIDYARDNLKAKNLYSRHLVSNQKIASLAKSVGFTKNGTPYTDGDGLAFQNIKLTL